MSKYLLLIFLLLPNICFGATYYVSTTGNDSYNSTQAQNINTPWLTINNAAVTIHNELDTSATIYVLPGNYNESYTRLRDDNIKLSGYNEKPIIRYTGAIDTLFIIEANNIEISNIEMIWDSTTTGVLISITGNYPVIHDNILWVDTTTNVPTAGDLIKIQAPVTGIGGYGTGAIIYNNILHDSINQTIDIVHADDVLVYNNYLYNVNDGIVFKGGSDNISVYNNIIINPISWGIGIGGTTGVTFNEHNYQAINSNVYNNIIYRDSSNDMQGIHIQGGTINNIFNNTIYRGSINITTGGDPASLDQYSSINTIKNNIVVGDGDDGIFYIASLNTTGNLVDNNNYYDLGNCTFTFHYGAYYNFSDWKITSSYDANSIELNPLFISSAYNDFRLKYNSPAIGAGIDVGLTHDFYGRKIHKTPDIGAIEFSPNYFSKIKNSTNRHTQLNTQNILN